MSAFSSDTCPEAETVLIHLLRETPSWRKMEMVGQMNEAVKMLMLSGLKNRYHHDPPDLLRRRMADLLLGPQLAVRVFGPLRRDKMRTEPLNVTLQVVEQWRDVIRVLKVQSDRLDLDYLQRWAIELNLVDLLQRALKESV